MRDTYVLNEALRADDGIMAGFDASDDDATAAPPRDYYRHFRRKAALRVEAAEGRATGDAAPRSRPPLTQAPAKPAEPRNYPLQRVDPLSLHWNSLRMVRPGLRRQFQCRIDDVVLQRDSAVTGAFDLLRTRLLQLLKANGWHRVAVTGPTPGSGATFTAVNLALSLARIANTRTVLMDLNQRDPGVAAALDLDISADMHGFLTGEVPMSEHLVRIGDTLAVGLARYPDEDAAELLQDPRAAEVLARMSAQLRPDVTICDLPPVLTSDDAAAFLPQVDGVILVADGTRTQAGHIRACERIFEGQTRVIGIVLNRARGSAIESWPT